MNVYTYNFTLMQTEVTNKILGYIYSVNGQALYM